MDYLDLYRQYLDALGGPPQAQRSPLSPLLGGLPLSPESSAYAASLPPTPRERGGMPQSTMMGGGYMADPLLGTFNPQVIYGGATPVPQDAMQLWRDWYDRMQSQRPLLGAGPEGMAFR